MRGTVIPPPFYIENFLRFQVQGSTTASLINMYGLVHRQTNGKNRKREWNGKIYFLGGVLGNYGE